jgi:hypothetical protein
VDDSEEDTTLSDTKHLHALAGLAGAAMLTLSPAAAAGSKHETIPVSGHGIDLASEAIVHSEQNTPTGVVKRLTEIVRLHGDLTGYVLYQPTQVFDFVDNTLTVTGTNVFSGTIAGSDPVILHSDQSRFEVDLATGEETGRVHLAGRNNPQELGWQYQCDLDVVGTGQTPEGNLTFDYRGVCTRRGH